MKLRPEKIMFDKPLNLKESVAAFTILKEVIDPASIKDNYFYVYVKDNYDLFIESVADIEVYWFANKLQVDDREALLCLVEFPSFWETLKDILYINGINNYKRYTVFTKNDLMGTGNRTWEEYLGENDADAWEFYRDILLVQDIVSIIEMDDEEEA